MTQKEIDDLVNKLDHNKVRIIRWPPIFMCPVCKSDCYTRMYIPELDCDEITCPNCFQKVYS